MAEALPAVVRNVAVLAEEEARALEHDYVGTEHVLLALLRGEESRARHLLETLDVTAEHVGAQVRRIVSKEASRGRIPFTPAAQEVLELAMTEASELGDDHVDTEHILLGLVRNRRVLAARILLDFNVDAERVRERVTRPPGAA